MFRMMSFGKIKRKMLMSCNVVYGEVILCLGSRHSASSDIMHFCLWRIDSEFRMTSFDSK